MHQWRDITFDEQHDLIRLFSITSSIPLILFTSTTVLTGLAIFLLTFVVFRDVTNHYVSAGAQHQEKQQELYHISAPEALEDIPQWHFR